MSMSIAEAQKISNCLPMTTILELVRTQYPDSELADVTHDHEAMVVTFGGIISGNVTTPYPITEVPPTRITKSGVRTLDVSFNNAVTFFDSVTTIIPANLNLMLLSIWDVYYTNQYGFQPNHYLKRITMVDGVCSYLPQGNFIDMRKVESSIGSLDAVTEWVKAIYTVMRGMDFQHSNADATAKQEAVKALRNQWVQYAKPLETSSATGYGVGSYQIETYVCDSGNGDEVVVMFSEDMFCALSLLLNEDFREFVALEMRSESLFESSTGVIQRYMAAGGLAS